MKFLYYYLKQRKTGVFLFSLFTLLFLCSFILYKIPAGAVLYPAMLCAFFAAVFIFFDYKKELKKHNRLVEIRKYTENLLDFLPHIETVDDEDYQQIIRLMDDEQRQRTTEMNIKYSDMTDYYTAWVHQIKTPISSIKLTLQNSDAEYSGIVAEDLFRIEQYVEMVLMFLRLDSEYTDYVIQEYNLDEIIKGAVKKFAGQFIRRKIHLAYEPFGITAVTDEKWLSFVIEQVISNALKYTPEGEISIYLESPKTLCIKDTGIGIAPEDIQRIFEKGFTGCNGRTDKKASGIGLYLCKRICTNLGHTISALSSGKNGTVIKINLDKKKLFVE